ncbi:Hachiman antiphage defense system protein HamA [Marilutibacter spongiae]|uniref:DUF1837 domain-containing protein n=1 Tax=Marilutibacter spongiae TaxID=2025720 RepID=A0A7W3Y5V6_9GAMM|nr:Hachiman antiphage defense system protein HamA [Lysobacter spongiae]MBB1060587.1 DUF1837 domain-containing protein [Lysobacter spongiae]
MDELGFDFEDAVAWFPHEQDQPYVLVRVSDQNVAELAAAMGVPLRRCYITDAAIEQAVQQHGVTRADVVRSVLPDAGSTMSGDFGEVLGYFYQAARELPATAIGPKKWRLKQDRTKPAPKSDVVHFVMPNRPHASEADVILCSEVKAKATNGASQPIANAIADCKKDRISRLANTLVWLRDRAVTTNLGDVDIPLLNRFIDAVDSPAASKRFRAVAVISNALLDDELVSAPTEADSEYTLVVIGVPNLHATYTAVYAAAIESVA